MVAKMKGTSVDWPSVDFVVDRNNLRKLLRWINGARSRQGTFRMDMQLAGNRTVLLNRWEQSDRMYSPGGYGFSFETATTTPVEGCELGVCYDRIVKYVSIMIISYRLSGTYR